MRLIDADKLFPDRITKKGVAVSQSQIANAPTVEERKEGEWIRNPSVNGVIDDFRCSCCNSNPPVMSINISWGWNLTNFCPNCGAKMKCLCDA